MGKRLKKNKLKKKTANEGSYKDLFSEFPLDVLQSAHVLPGDIWDSWESFSLECRCYVL